MNKIEEATLGLAMVALVFMRIANSPSANIVD